MSDETAEQLKAEQEVRDAEATADKERLARETAEVEPTSAVDRLRAFEDEHLGADAVRLNGRVERGSGSRFQNPQVMTPELRRQHAALEKLIESEQHLADAHAKLLQAEADHETALAACKPRPDAVE